MQSSIPERACQEREGIFFPMASLYGYLEQLTDQRDPRGVRYPLVRLVAIIILAKIA